MPLLGVGISLAVESAFGILPDAPAAPPGPVQPPAPAAPAAGFFRFDMSGRHVDPTFNGFNKSEYDLNFQTAGGAADDAATTARAAFPITSGTGISPGQSRTRLPRGWAAAGTSAADDRLSMLRVFQPGADASAAEVLFGFGDGLGQDVQVSGVHDDAGPDLVDAVRTGTSWRMAVGFKTLAGAGFADASDTADPYLRVIGQAAADFARIAHLADTDAANNPDLRDTVYTRAPAILDTAFGNQEDGSPYLLQALTGETFDMLFPMVHYSDDEAVHINLFSRLFRPTSLPANRNAGTATGGPAGRWIVLNRADSTTGTRTIETGPTISTAFPDPVIARNASEVFAYVECHGSPHGQTQRENRSALIIADDFMPEQGVCVQRVLTMRLALQGVGFDDPRVGLEVYEYDQDPDPGGGTASQVLHHSNPAAIHTAYHIVRGWEYPGITGHQAGNTVAAQTVGSYTHPYQGGARRQIVELGGWCDVPIAIQDSTTHVAICPRFRSSGAPTLMTDYSIQWLRWSGVFA